MECYTKSEEMNILPQFSTRYQQPYHWLNPSSTTEAPGINNRVSRDAAMCVNDQTSLDRAIE